MKHTIIAVLMLFASVCFGSVKSPLAGKSYAYHQTNEGHHYLTGWAFFFTDKGFTHMKLRIPKDKTERKIFFKQYHGTYELGGSVLRLKHEKSTCGTVKQEETEILYPFPDDSFTIALNDDPMVITYLNAEKFESPATTFEKEQVLVEDTKCEIVD